MIKLRGHHLICLHYYHGGGLTEIYAENLKEKMEQANRGEAIVIAGGADDICSACPYLEDDLCQGIPAEEAEIRELDQNALALLHRDIGDRILWTDIRQQLESAPSTWFETFCYGCTWKQYCDRGIVK